MMELAKSRLLVQMELFTSARPNLTFDLCLHGSRDGNRVCHNRTCMKVFCRASPGSKSNNVSPSERVCDLKRSLLKHEYENIC